MTQLSLDIDKTLQQLTHANRFVIALSGGLDSIVLTTLVKQWCHENDKSCIAVHVHHGLSANADHWVDVVKNFCHQIELQCVIEHVQLDLNNGDSIEQQARQKRYQALSQHIGDNDVLLTGQHADDQLETFLLALKRGSGPKGLSSMPQCAPFGKGFIVRPLLQVARSELEAYAQSQKLKWIEDESNDDERYDRNFLRHRIVPELKMRWPSIASSVERSAQLCAEQESLLDELLSDRLENAINADGSLSIAPLVAISDLMRNRLIRMWFEQLGKLMPSAKQLSLIWQEVALAKEDANPILNVVDCQVRRFSNKLYLVERGEDLTQWTYQITLNEPVQLPDDLGCLCLEKCGSGGSLSLNEEQLAGLTVTFDPEGLSAKPVGRQHSRKLKKLFQEYQVPSWLRRRTPIILFEGKVVAVVGLFVDQAFSGQECDVVWYKTTQFVQEL
ncbi:tRNA lysidine(34) synthetase TilS [Vibrio mexicanus]|uniref:tRNA lysidine(34) synthetase TilS n=1 Tax=Vibrio mexicanus TaxID=1004326 RepID=UPI00063C3B98|nr:tRNA lysidine(34) synthetase TilS [Vibrio mexicanus]